MNARISIETNATTANVIPTDRKVRLASAHTCATNRLVVPITRVDKHERLRIVPVGEDVLIQEAEETATRSPEDPRGARSDITRVTVQRISVSGT